jgi:hypothetical protein
MGRRGQCAAPPPVPVLIDVLALKVHPKSPFANPRGCAGPTNVIRMRCRVSISDQVRLALDIFLSKGDCLASPYTKAAYHSKFSPRFSATVICPKTGPTVSTWARHKRAPRPDQKSRHTGDIQEMLGSRRGKTRQPHARPLLPLAAATAHVRALFFKPRNRRNTRKLSSPSDLCAERNGPKMLSQRPTSFRSDRSSNFGLSPSACRMRRFEDCVLKGQQHDSPGQSAASPWVHAVKRISFPAAPLERSEGSDELAMNRKRTTGNWPNQAAPGDSRPAAQ